MNKKDIISVVISLIILVACGTYLYTVMFPSNKSSVASEQEQVKKPEFTGEIDNETLNQIKKLNDYGEAPLDNVGRVNPFGPLQ